MVTQPCLRTALRNPETVQLLTETDPALRQPRRRIPF